VGKHSPGRLRVRPRGGRRSRHAWVQSCRTRDSAEAHSLCPGRVLRPWLSRKCQGARADPVGTGRTRAGPARPLAPHKRWRRSSCSLRPSVPGQQKKRSLEGRRRRRRPMLHGKLRPSAPVFDVQKSRSARGLPGQARRMKIRLLHHAVSRVQSLTFAVDVLDFNAEALRCFRVAHCLFVSGTAALRSGS